MENYQDGYLLEDHTKHVIGKYYRDSRLENRNRKLLELYGEYK